MMPLARPSDISVQISEALFNIVASDVFDFSIGREVHDPILDHLGWSVLKRPRRSIASEIHSLAKRNPRWFMAHLSHGQ